jgi:hypothetical protein
MQFYFFEGAGKDAFDKLEALRQRLESLPFIHSTNLLKNTNQSDLYLLVVETSEEPHIEAPEGVRVWTFTKVS